MAGERFESSVIPSGSKTGEYGQHEISRFESSVIPSGSKTAPAPRRQTP